MAKTKQITGFLVDTEGVIGNPKGDIRTTIKAVTIDKTLESYYKTLHCDLIEIPTYKFGGKSYDVICDEEGLIKGGQPVISAIDAAGRPALVGSIFIVNTNCRSLSEADIERLDKCVRQVQILSHPTGELTRRQVMQMSIEL